jgi:hypothetical protein
MFRIGGLEKTLLVHGRRAYYSGAGLTTSSPLPFTSRPIHYEWAFAFRLAITRESINNVSKHTMGALLQGRMNGGVVLQWPEEEKPNRKTVSHRAQPPREKPKGCPPGTQQLNNGKCLKTPPGGFR